MKYGNVQILMSKIHTLDEYFNSHKIQSIANLADKYLVMINPTTRNFLIGKGFLNICYVDDCS